MLNEKLPKKRNAYVLAMKAVMYLSVAITAALVLFLVGYVLIKGIPNITWSLLSTSPSYISDHIGILPDILNTMYIIIVTLLIVLPLGVGAAVYLTEYASNKKVVAIVEYAAETLSGIPSIIYGLVGMLFFCEFLGTRISDQTAFFLLGELIEYGSTEMLFSQPTDKRTEDYITGRFG